MKYPKISIIMPSYNAEKYLSKSIDSILKQSFKDFEFIIIDDGSIDNTKKILSKYKKRDKRIKILTNKDNLGLQKTLNKGLKYAKGDYIARMDADDISSKERLQVQLNFLENNPKIFMVGSSAIVIDENDNRIGLLRKFNDSERTKKKLETSNCIIHPSIMFRNEGDIYYRENFKTSEDYDLYLRFLSNGKKLTNLPEFLIKYRISSGSFVSTMPNQDLYFEKAKEFYSERETRNKDSYKLLKSPKKDIHPDNPKKEQLRTKIFIELQDRNSGKTRKSIRNYIKKYGYKNEMMIFYSLSFLPRKLFIKLQKNF